MSKEKYYNKIKRYIYRKFEELEVFESNDGNYLYLRYKHAEFAKIVVNKSLLKVSYYTGFRDKINKIVPLEKRDFEILLKRWIKDTFQMKMKNANAIKYKEVLLVVEDTF